MPEFTLVGSVLVVKCACHRSKPQQHHESEVEQFREELMLEHNVKLDVFSHQPL